MARLKFPNPDSLEVHLSILGRSIWGADHSGRGIQSVFPSGSASSHVCFSLCSPQVETSLYRFLEKAWEEASQGLRRRGGVQAQTWITDLRCFPACLIPQDFFLSRVECFSIWKCHKEIKCSLFKTTGTSMTTESLSLLPSSLSSAFRGGPFGDCMKGWDHSFILPLKCLHFCFSDTFFFNASWHSDSLFIKFPGHFWVRVSVWMLWKVYILILRRGTSLFTTSSLVPLHLWELYDVRLDLGLQGWKWSGTWPWF